MSFDPHTLASAIKAHGPVVRVVVASVAGLAPREVGAAMLIWADGQLGTIGGGALEWEATARARAMTGAARVDRLPLGPALGQCCGGAVTLVSERFDTAPQDGLVFARRIDGGSAMPLAVKRLVTAARSEGLRPAAQLLDGWMIEPISRPERAIWIWGAGHVGRAIVDVLVPLPDLAITWIDTGKTRFPADIPKTVTQVVAADPGTLVSHAPPDAEHLILTFSHEIDLDLCHRLLVHGFARCGLIGSATKWARFQARLASLGHSSMEIARIDCPIGDPGLGKHPQAIAVGVAATLLKNQSAITAAKDRAG